MDDRSRYGSSGDDVARSETVDLISADKVEGTSVYDPNGNKLGSIDTVMIDKVSGHVAYAVLSFGGFLGMGTSQYPLPWDQLKYDTREGGYVVALTEEQLKGAPSYSRGSTGDWTDRDWTDRIDEYYRGTASSGLGAGGSSTAGSSTTGSAAGGSGVGGSGMRGSSGASGRGSTVGGGTGGGRSTY